MKTSKLLDAEQISFQEISTEWISLDLDGQRFILDVDTLHELAFRSASFLSLVESHELDQEEDSDLDDLRH